MKKFIHSVAFRLSLLFTLILTAAVIILSISFFSMLSASVQSQTNEELTLAAENIEATIFFNSISEEQTASPTLPYYLTYIVYNEEEEFIEGNDPYLPHLPVTPSKPRSYFEKNFYLDGDLNILYFAKKARIQNEVLTIMVATNLDTDSSSKFKTEIPKAILLGIMPLLLICFIVSIFMTRRTMSPVVKMTDSANKISSTNLDTLLPVSKKGNELDELAETFNDLFTRLKNDFDRERQFTSDVSHELKTPVAVILGQANLLRRWGKDDPAQLEKSLGTIINETKSMEAIINNLLQMSRLESGRVQPQITTVDVKDLFDRLKDETLSVKPETIINYDQTINTMVPGDIELLHQVFTVIVSNSLKFAPSPATLTFSCKQNNSTTIIELEDNGQGFGEENIPHVFERFYRGDAAHTRSAGGSGLGLSIAKTIIESMNGKISAHNATHTPSGAMVRIELPNKAN